MSVPLRQQITVAKYIISQKLKGNKRYPLVLMLEPLFSVTWLVQVVEKLPILTIY